MTGGATIGRNVVLPDDADLGPGVTIGNNVTVYPGVRVGEGTVVLDGAVLGRLPRSTGNTTRPLGENLAPLRIGAGCVIGANAVLYAGSELGARVLVGDLASIREGCHVSDDVVVGRGVLVMYETTIGARTRVIDGAILTGRMTIESDVFIGPGAKSVNDNEVYLSRFGLTAWSVRGPLIRRFALIGTGANVAGGVEVGMGAVVAPSAMVTRDVAPWTIVGGVPARRMGEVRPEERRRILEKFGLAEGG